MAATNKSCFEKNCMCASCTFKCSLHLIDNLSCKNGVHNCDKYKQETTDEYYLQYIQQYSRSNSIS